MKAHCRKQYSPKIWGITLVFLSLAMLGSKTHGAQSTGQLTQELTSDVMGVVTIESPKVGTLLQLRGIAGKGRLTVRQEGVDTCLSSPIRLAAGDFGGSNIGIHSSGRIRLVIYSPEVADKLISGVEITSEDYKVTELSDEQLGDIKIGSGLSLNYGFVLNPGEWSWSSLFGRAKKTVNCELLSQ